MRQRDAREYLDCQLGRRQRSANGFSEVSRGSCTPLPAAPANIDITVTASSPDGTFTGGIGQHAGARWTETSISSTHTANWVKPRQPQLGAATVPVASRRRTSIPAAVSIRPPPSPPDNGNILVVGTTGGNFGLVRYIDDPNSRNDGNPDTSFGTSGLVTTTFSIGSATASAVAVDSANGKIVVAGVAVGRQRPQ